MWNKDLWLIFSFRWLCANTRMRVKINSCISITQQLLIKHVKSCLFNSSFRRTAKETPKPPTLLRGIHWWPMSSCPHDSPQFWHVLYCPACRTTLIATRFWVVMICPIIKCLTVLRVFCYFVWFVFINHNFQFYFKLCTYCNILDINLS